MKITTQDGVLDECVDFELSGKVIRYTPKSDRRKKIICGTYDSVQRATEIFARMTFIGWNNKNPEYIMPNK